MRFMCYKFPESTLVVDHDSLHITEEKFGYTTVEDIGNYTYNVSPMYIESMGKSISDFHNYKASDLIPILTKGLEEMQSNPGKYKEMNPSNGWGDYQGAMQFLFNIKDACERLPETRVDVS